MANYSNLITAITTAINTNGSQLITGASLQSVLLQMVGEMGQAGYIFGGIVSPATEPLVTDSNLFYIAATSGTYTHFDGIVVEAGEIVILTYLAGAWIKNTVSSVDEKINQLESKVAEGKINGDFIAALQAILRKAVYTDPDVSGEIDALSDWAISDDWEVLSGVLIFKNVASATASVSDNLLTIQ